VVARQGGRLAVRVDATGVTAACAGAVDQQCQSLAAAWHVAMLQSCRPRGLVFTQF
jgi:hypothetical protein